MSDNKTSSGIGFGSLLLLIFITLKLCKVIDWDWWWVMAPLWIPIALLAVVSLLYLLFAGWEWHKEKKNPPKSKWKERLEQMQKQREKQQS